MKIQSDLSLREGNTNHSPSGVTWIEPKQWEAAKWDKKPKNLCDFKNKGELCAWAFPNVNTMRGLKEFYEETKPFKDEKNPTTTEIDTWHIKVINHFRSLFGIVTEAEPDACLYVLANFAFERRNSTKWDAKYPGRFDSTDGPCTGPNGEQFKNGHCGGTFVPNCEDQQKEMGWGPDKCCVKGMSEAASSGTVNANVNWGIKLARYIGQTVCGEGTVGHAGPWFRRQKVGLAFWVDPTLKSTQVEAKFSGSFDASLCEIT
jgi:hypothetical protein